MIAQVPYLVPVVANVDLSTGQVDRVVVIDESISLDHDGDFMDFDRWVPLDEKHKAKAIEIAETQSWPAWENGF